MAVGDARDVYNLGLEWDGRDGEGAHGSAEGDGDRLVP